MKRWLLALMLLAVAFSGCMEKSPNVEELRSIMLNSTSDLDSYKFNMQSQQEIEVQNLTSPEQNVTKFTVISKGEGSVNLTGRALSLVQSMVMTSENQSAEPLETSTYILNDTIYMQMGGNWTSLKIPEPDLIWSQQNQVYNQALLLNNSQIELLGSEKINGEDCYKIKVIPDMQTYAALLSEQVGSLLPLGSMDLEALYENSSLEWTTWITKDENILSKNEIAMDLTITPEMVGLPLQAGDFEMRIKTKATVNYTDFNQPLNITLPSEAANAQAISVVPIQSLPTS